MISPALSERAIEERANYHETEAAWFESKGQPTLARWSRQQAEDWRKKLPFLASTEPTRP